MKDFLFFSFHGCSLVCASTTVFRSVHFLLPFGKMTKEKKSYNAIQQQKTIKTNCLFFKLLFFVFFSISNTSKVLSSSFAPVLLSFILFKSAICVLYTYARYSFVFPGIFLPTESRAQNMVQRV